MYAFVDCQAIPHDAELLDFEIYGNIDVRFIWDPVNSKQDIQILAPVRYVLNKYDIEIIIKPGFTCDGGSVPRAFWTSVGSPYATRLLLAYLLHDALYAAEVFNTHSECDWAFLELMKELREWWYQRNKVWGAVRLAGGSVWNKHTPESIAEARSFIEIIDIHPKDKETQ